MPSVHFYFHNVERLHDGAITYYSGTSVHCREALKTPYLVGRISKQSQKKRRTTCTACLALQSPDASYLHYALSVGSDRTPSAMRLLNKRASCSPSDPSTETCLKLVNDPMDFLYQVHKQEVVKLLSKPLCVTAIQSFIATMQRKETSFERHVIYKMRKDGTASQRTFLRSATLTPPNRHHHQTKLAQPSGYSLHNGHKI